MVRLSYQELRCKEVVNVQDGRRLGRIIDIVFDNCGRIHGIVTVGFKKVVWWKPCEDIFIPWRNIKKIGDDVILVDLKIKITPYNKCDNYNQCSVMSEQKENKEIIEVACNFNTKRKQFYSYSDNCDNQCSE